VKKATAEVKNFEFDWSEASGRWSAVRRENPHRTLSDDQRK
jgi:hypothetical protein